jgi:hypothetical protein
MNQKLTSDQPLVPPFTYGATEPNSPVSSPTPSPQGSPVSTDAPIGIGGSSVFPESTRLISAPSIPNKPFESIYESAKPLPHVEPLPTPGAGAGTPSAPGPRSSGLGNSAINGPLPGWTE